MLGVLNACPNCQKVIYDLAQIIYAPTPLFPDFQK